MKEILEKLPPNILNDPLLKLLAELTLETFQVFQTPIHPKAVCDYIVRVYNGQMLTQEQKRLLRSDIYNYDHHVLMIMSCLAEIGVVARCTQARALIDSYYLKSTFQEIGTVTRDVHLASCLGFTAKLFAHYYNAVVESLNYAIKGNPDKEATSQDVIDSFEAKLKLSPCTISFKPLKANNFDMTSHHSFIIKKLLLSLVNKGLIDTKLNSLGEEVYTLKR